MKSSITLTALAAVMLLTFGASAARAAAAPYATLPSVNDAVRFDGSAGGETRAWAYPNEALLDSFLRGTIDASFGSASYDAYQRKMSAVLGSSLDYPNGTSAVVQRVQAFTYRGRQDVEVQVRVTSGQVRPLVWTTPAELVSATGRRYLK